VRSAARVVKDKARLRGWDVAPFLETIEFLDNKIHIFRKIGKKEAQSRASKLEKKPTQLVTYWEALKAYYEANFKIEEDKIFFNNDSLRNLLLGFLFIHRSPLRSQNVLELELHNTIRLGPKGYELKLGHQFKTSGYGIHGATNWMRLPHHINYWMAIYIAKVRPTYPGAEKTDRLFLTRR